MRGVFCSVVLVVGSSVEPVAPQPPWPLTTAAGDNMYPIVLPLLTGSTLLLEDFVDVFHFAKSLKEGDQIEELGV